MIPYQCFGSNHFSRQLHNLWIFAGLVTCYTIQKACNKSTFEDWPISFHHLYMSIAYGIVYAGKVIPGYSNGLDLRIISSLGIQHIPRKALIIHCVLWSPP